MSLVTGLAVGLGTAGTAAAAVVVGNDQIASETRAVEASAHVVEVQTESLDVRIVQGPRAQIELQADANLLPLIEARWSAAEGGQSLLLRWKPGTSLRTKTAPKVTVTLPSVQRLVVRGSGEIALDALAAPSLHAQVLGSGDLKLGRLSVDRLDVQVQGAGDVRASGKARQLKLRIEGSGDVWADELESDSVDVAIAGSGDARVHAVNELSVAIAGSGDVRYRGRPRLTQSIAGSGSVSAR